MTSEYLFLSFYCPYRRPCLLRTTFLGNIYAGYEYSVSWNWILAQQTPLDVDAIVMLIALCGTLMSHPSTPLKDRCILIKTTHMVLCGHFIIEKDFIAFWTKYHVCYHVQLSWLNWNFESCLNRRNEGCSQVSNRQTTYCPHTSNSEIEFKPRNFWHVFTPYTFRTHRVLVIPQTREWGMRKVRVFCLVGGHPKLHSREWLCWSVYTTEMRIRNTFSFRNWLCFLHCPQPSHWTNSLTVGSLACWSTV